MHMTKTILRYAFPLMLTMAVPVATIASEMYAPELAVEQNEPVLTVQNSTVTVTGAAGETLEVVSLTGRAVATYRIEGPAQRIELNLPKGCYILKVGKVARKVTVR